jgi:uncharacterized protein YndB with AHSA1/START domain
LVYAATRPNTFRVERSIVVNAAAAKVFALINDVRGFNLWNPYSKKDASIKLTYEGPASGAGAKFTFEGNKQVGTGSVEVTSMVENTQVDMRLIMLAPFPADNTITFTLTPEGTGTRVSWAMQGPSPYFAKVMGILFSMDKMVGKDFEAGLADLKVLAEGDGKE